MVKKQKSSMSDRKEEVCYFSALDAAYVFFYIQTLQLWSGLIFVLIHHGHRMILCDADVL